MIFTKFKELADEKFQSKYEYVESSFEGRFVEIICKEHGTFKKDIYSHLSGVGCNLCNSFNVKLNECVDLVLASNSSFKFIRIEKVKRKTYVVFECSKGHVWKFTSGYERGCYKCSRLDEKISTIQRLADANQVEVLISDCSVTTICPTHGENTVSYKSFKHTKGCKKCKRINHKYTTDFFKKQCKTLDTNYDYSKVVCESCYDVVEIICKEHGSFFQKAYSHLSGHKCKKCSFKETRSSYSLAEVEIFELIGGVHGDRSLIYPKELDVYTARHNLAVEYDGVYWHSTDDFSKMNEFKYKHVRKTEMCQQKNTNLLHIFENEWVDERTKRIWTGELLKRTQQISATEADAIEKLTYERTNEFIKINSLKPIELSCFNYGLVASGVLFLVCQFVKTDSSNTYTMVKTEHSDYKSQQCDVLKLIEKFKFEHNPNEILCEIDNRVEFLEDYLDFGFVFLSLTLPKAYAVSGFELTELTEITNIEQHIKHNRIIFDCGTTLMILK